MRSCKRALLCLLPSSLPPPPLLPTVNQCQIPKTSNFNYVRISVLFLVALLASSEYYEYCSNPSCDRLGQNAWLILAIMQVTRFFTSWRVVGVGGLCPSARE